MHKNNVPSENFGLHTHTHARTHMHAHTCTCARAHTHTHRSQRSKPPDLLVSGDIAGRIGEALKFRGVLETLVGSGIVDLHVASCVGRVVAVLAHKALQHLMSLHVPLEVAALLRFVGAPGKGKASPLCTKDYSGAVSLLCRKDYSGAASPLCTKDYSGAALLSFRIKDYSDAALLSFRIKDYSDSALLSFRIKESSDAELLSF